MNHIWFDNKTCCIILVSPPPPLKDYIFVMVIFLLWLYFCYGYKTVKILYTSFRLNALLYLGMYNFSLILITPPLKKVKNLF